MYIGYGVGTDTGYGIGTGNGVGYGNGVEIITGYIIGS
jgi:hypothetical protein